MGNVTDTQFIRLYAQHQTQLFRYVSSLVPRLQDAEDVLGQVTVVLLENFDTYQPGTNFLAWSRRIAHLRVLEYYRKSKRQRLLSERVLEKLAREAECRDTVSEERLLCLHKCIEKLSPKDRDLIDRRYTEGIKAVDLAHQLGRSANSLYLSLGRIRRSLLRCIEQRLSAAPLQTE
jgi:RNA polymerase sigma-70 factor (ECF subfamily)